MFEGIFNALYALIFELVSQTMFLISAVFADFMEGNDLIGTSVNLSLFSDTPIFTMNMYDLILLIFTLFYSIFFIALLYKVSKKVIKSIFGVLKWW